MKARSMKFMRTGSGCFLCLSHKLSPEGYLRMRWADGFIGTIHRLIWEHHNGTVPEGFELHHTCHNRFCCNHEHLELILKAHHNAEHRASHTDKKLDAMHHWMKHRCSGAKLAKAFSIPIWTADRWIRRWRYA